MTLTHRGPLRGALALTTGLALISVAPAFASPGPGGKHETKGAARACQPYGNSKSRLIVSGQGEAHVAPDFAEIQLGVTTQAASAADAMQENSALQSKVIDSLQDAGIERKDIQTSDLRLNPRMEYPENGAPKINGYQAANTVLVRIAEIHRMGDIMDTIVAAGANEIQGISFQRRDSAATSDEALRAAVADARRKAEVMADAAGMTLGPVMMMRDSQAAEGPQPMLMRAQDAKASTPIEAGELSVSAQVQVQYALIGDKGPKKCGPGQGKAPGDLPKPTDHENATPGSSSLPDETN